MPTNFPTSVDNFTNPTANDSLNLPSHSTQHANANDAIEAIETYMGLVLLNTTTFTAQTGLTISNVFSSTYNFYRVEIGIKGSVNQDLFCRLALAGTPESGTNYYYQRLNAFGTSVSAASVGATSLPIAPYSSNDFWMMSVDLAFPANATATGLNSNGGRSDNMQFNAGTHNQAVAYDGFNIFAGSGNITGTIAIYGYRK
jgi:hypothetical protein